MCGYELLHFIITGGGGGGGGMNDNHVSLPNVAAAGYAWKPNSIL